MGLKICKGLSSTSLGSGLLQYNKHDILGGPVTIFQCLDFDNLCKYPVKQSPWNRTTSAKFCSGDANSPATSFWLYSRFWERYGTGDGDIEWLISPKSRIQWLQKVVFSRITNKQHLKTSKGFLSPAFGLNRPLELLCSLNSWWTKCIEMLRENG